ncbi:PepSY domain-containing protein [Actinoplanes awajinensis]|uniref:Uncharacterized protein n=1 Tax=Actinoplanes awajinensis subsp. mycoplanecinus TaxID=135947 RepID=A0A101JAH2_9ACTN|nr:PepSY domain-containing protein [Actinoplanes awajinensis]KUL23165.1 hypothetical protein ADL15_46745 [Actinoplanes awajinensis subsp. mycoplanecinus]
MNTAKLRSKRVLVASAAVVAALGAGGFWATAANADVSGSDRDRIGSAATQAVPGTVVDVEESDDRGEAYEVEVRQADGSEVSVGLDKDLKVLSQQKDGADADDRVLTAAERSSAEKAALAAVGSGTILDVEASDDQGVAYEAEVRDAAGQEWDVQLDTAFAVVAKTADND